MSDNNATADGPPAESTPPPSSIVAGDVVTLASSSLPMTVRYVRGDDCGLVWFDDDLDLQTADHIPLACLKKVF